MTIPARNKVAPLPDMGSGPERLQELRQLRSDVKQQLSTFQAEITLRRTSVDTGVCVPIMGDWLVLCKLTVFGLRVFLATRTTCGQHRRGGLVLPNSQKEELGGRGAPQPETPARPFPRAARR